MTVGEATRQFQATLEARRALVSNDLFSLDEERAQADAELTLARLELEREWLEWIVEAT